jgi:hypothetical protein
MSKTYGFKYILERIIPLKHLGKEVSKSIVLSYQPNFSESDSGKSRKELIKTIISLFDLSNDTLEELEERIINVFNDYNLSTFNVENDFNDLIVRKQRADTYRRINHRVY